MQNLDAYEHIRAQKRQETSRLFYEKNSDRVHATHICELCGGQFTYFNSSRHKNTQMHQRMLAFIERHQTQELPSVQAALQTLAPKRRGRPRKYTEAQNAAD